MPWVVCRWDALDVLVVDDGVHGAEVGASDYADSSDWGLRNVVLLKRAAVVEEELLGRVLDLEEQAHFGRQLVVVGCGFAVQSVFPVDGSETSLNGEVCRIR